MNEMIISLCQMANLNKVIVNGNVAYFRQKKSLNEVWVKNINAEDGIYENEYFQRSNETPKPIPSIEGGVQDFDLIRESAYALLPFTSNDEMNPKMECVFFDKENIVASNMHMLRTIPNNTGVENLYLHKSILMFLPKVEKLLGKIEHIAPSSTILFNDNVIIKQNISVESYPNYLSILTPFTPQISFRLTDEHIAIIKNNIKKYKVIKNLVIRVEINEKLYFKLRALGNMDFEVPLFEEEMERNITTPITPDMGIIMPKVDGENLDYTGFDPVYLLTMGAGVYRQSDCSGRAFFYPEEKEVKPVAKAKPVSSTSKDSKPVAAPVITIKRYSDKAIAIFGDTKAVKDVLKQHGAKFNPFLRNEGTVQPGWVASLKRESEIRNALKL